MRIRKGATLALVLVLVAVMAGCGGGKGVKKTPGKDAAAAKKNRGQATGYAMIYDGDTALARDVQATFEGGGAVLPDPASLPELADRYPEASMWGELPSSALYLRHAEGVRLEDVAFSLAKPDPRPWIWTGDAPALDARRITVDGRPAAIP